MNTASTSDWFWNLTGGCLKAKKTKHKVHQIKKAVHKALLLNCLIFVALCEFFEFFVVKTTFETASSF